MSLNLSQCDIVTDVRYSPSAYYGPTSANSPLASLRVALQSSLLTTQGQCDSVRELLSALTSPVQLSQLSEMYAPASPQKPSFAQLDHPRPVSDPGASWRRRSMPAGVDPTSPLSKRATWSPSARTPSSPRSPLFKEHEKSNRRRSQLSSVFTPEKLYAEASASAPPSPLAHRVLQDVQEEESSDSELQYARDENVFGVAALDLRRKRRESGMEVLGLGIGAGVPPPSYSATSNLAHTPSHSSHHSLSSFLTPSRFTLIQTARHPLSLSALHLALHGALAAKRYACSHLLALRFEEDAEDAAYWEDVRSVMALLTSTFADASARLLAALDEAEKRRMKDERPSTESLVGSSREGSASPDSTSSKDKSKITSMRSMAEMYSFAPMPSHLARFAAHVDTLSTALNDAREHLESCVASLRADKEPCADDAATPVPGADGTLGDVFTDTSSSPSNPNPTLEAYDRFRRELGFALRECERGRERLLDVIASSKPAPQSDDDDEDVFDDAEASQPPALAHDASSESTGADSFASPKDSPLETPVGMPESSTQAWEDAQEHLLLSASATAVEQVFEGESGSGAAFTRERSKLSREERIALVKARRESGRVFGAETQHEEETPRKGRESWGPGGEVVQELKDVIWKVGEKRRKLHLRASMPPPERPSRALPDLPDLSGLSGVPAVQIELVDADDTNTDSHHPIHPSGLALQFQEDAPSPPSPTAAAEASS